MNDTELKLREQIARLKSAINDAIALLDADLVDEAHSLLIDANSEKDNGPCTTTGK